MQQQTVLRVKTNVTGNTLVTPPHIFYVVESDNPAYPRAWTGGTGTASDPYVGPFSDFNTNIDVYTKTGNEGESKGVNGTVYYKFDLGTYTGTSVDFYANYYFEYTTHNLFKPDVTPRTYYEYAVQKIGNNEYRSLRLDGDDYITFAKRTIYTLADGTFSMYFVPDQVPVQQFDTFDTLDLYSNIPIKINKSYAELQDIAKRNSDYSIGLTLPGSKKNNRFFEEFYNVDNQSLFFDVNKRVECSVLIDDEKYFDGYLRLNKINVQNSKVEYDVTLFSSVGDLFGNIGNNLLKDLNFDNPYYHFNQYFTLYNVTAPWRYDVLQSENLPLALYPPVHNGYVYLTGATPNISGGTVESQTRLYTTTVTSGFTSYSEFEAAGGKEYRFNSPKNPVLDNQLKPGLNVYNLIKLIFDTYGYSIKSDFFNTPWFKQLYLYGYYSSDTTKFAYQTQAPETLPYDQIQIHLSTGFTGSPSVALHPILYTVNKQTKVPALCEENITFTVRKNLCNGTQIPFTGTIFAGTTGYTFDLNTCPGGGFPGQETIQTEPVTSPQVGTLSYFEQANGKPIAPGTNVNFKEYDYVNFSYVIDPLHKQIDLLSSIAKKFNLVFTVNPDNPKEIIIEPYDFYIGTGNIYDWSDKISFDKGFSVEPALNYVESEIVLTDLEDGDDGNIQFKNQNNRIYGQQNIFNQTDFKSSQKKIDTIFSPEIIRKWDANVAIPLGINYAASSQANDNGQVDYLYKGLKSKLKLIYNLGNFSPFADQLGESYLTTTGNTSWVGGVNTAFFRVQQSNGTNPLNETYALASYGAPVISNTIPIGNKNKINDDSLTNLFASEKAVDLGLGQPLYDTYTPNNLYSVFYQNRITNLYNSNTRFLSGYFYLKLSDIKNLRANDLIKVNNQYFVWNKIQDYNLTNTELTKIELIQTNNSPNTYPTRYFKYQYCNDSNVYKFKTDLINPNLRKTYFYWSVYYDYNIGVLGGNADGFVAANPSLFRYETGFEYWAYTMNEITQSEYDAISLNHTQDPNDIAFINSGDYEYTVYDSKFENSRSWVFTNQSGVTQSMFFNLARTCSEFTGYCATNHVTLSAAPTPISVTPTPTPSPYPVQPSAGPMVGSLIVSYDEINGSVGYTDIQCTVNGNIRKVINTDINSEYSTNIYSGDTVDVAIVGSSGTNSILVYRRDYTVDDQGGDNGIRDTYIISGTTTVSFTVDYGALDYNFEYRVIGQVVLPTSPTPTPTLTPTNTVTPTFSPTPTRTPPACFLAGIDTNTGFDTAHYVQDMYEQADGKILVVGSFYYYDGTVERRGIVRLNSNGSLDSSFVYSTTDIADQYYSFIIPNADGSYYLGGRLRNYNGTTVSNFIKINSNGSLDTSYPNNGPFANSEQSPTWGIKDSSGKIVLVGDFLSYSGVSVGGIVRLNTDGTIDTSFVTGTGFNVSYVSGQPIHYPYDVQQQSDGKYIIGGNFTSYSGVTKNNIIRLNTDGSIDNTFTAYGTGASGDYVSNVDILSDGKIIIGGFFETFNGAQVYGIGKLNTDGSLDTAFKTGTGYGFAPNSIGVFYTNPSHTGDYIYVAGTFGSYNYSGVSYSAQGGIKLNLNDGSVDTSFVISNGGNRNGFGTPPSSTTRVVVPSASGYSIWGGDFVQYNYYPTYRIVKLDQYGDVYNQADCVPATSTPTPTPTLTKTPTATPAATSTPTPTIAPTSTPTTTPTPTATIAPGQNVWETDSYRWSENPNFWGSFSPVAPTPTVTSTITPTASITPTGTPAVSTTPTLTPTKTPTMTPTPSAMPITVQYVIQVPNYNSNSLNYSNMTIKNGTTTIANIANFSTSDDGSIHSGTTSNYLIGGSGNIGFTAARTVCRTSGTVSIASTYQMTVFVNGVQQSLYNGPSAGTLTVTCGTPRTQSHTSTVFVNPGDNVVVKWVDNG